MVPESINAAPVETQEILIKVSTFLWLLISRNQQPHKFKLILVEGTIKFMGTIYQKVIFMTLILWDAILVQVKVKVKCYKYSTVSVRSGIGLLASG